MRYPVDAPGRSPLPTRYVVIAAGVLGALLLARTCAEERPKGVLAPGVSARSSASPPAVIPELPGEISVRTLLREMVDITALAKLPDPPYVARAASSYDRRSLTPTSSDGWFANDDWASLDRANYLRAEDRAGRREYVLMDVTGPGALVRIWSASPAGIMRLYFDGEEKPEVEIPFELLVRGRGPIPEPFSYVAAKGFNAYFPLPFRRGIKVTIDSLVAKNPWQDGNFERIYYHLSYRSYGRDVSPRVRTYRRHELAAMLAGVEATARVFREPWRAYEPPPDVTRVPLAADSGSLRASVERAGGGVIRELSLFVHDTSETALSRARITMRFDGEVTVETPLADFFGAGPTLTPYDSLPFTVRADGTLVCRFVMPFRQRAEVVVEGAPNAEGALAVVAQPFTDASLYFHARYRPPSVVDSQPPKDLRMIDIEGEGVYAGDVFGIHNPNDRWWGEGDEKIYLDGETFPSFFGTGTEDYYGYAWSTGELFFRALHAQTRAGGPGFSGSFSVNRFRTLDAIPFKKSLRFDMELWHWGRARVTWQGFIYYYARPGAKDDLERRVAN